MKPELSRRLAQAKEYIIEDMAGKVGYSRAVKWWDEWIELNDRDTFEDCTQAMQNIILAAEEKRLAEK
jgi:hypothetical protein